MAVKAFTLGKNERLKSRKLIEQLFREGNRFQQFPFYIYIIFPKLGDATLQAGFGVSSKNFRKAVERNRIKRLTREAYRLEKNALERALTSAGRKLAVFFIYTGKELPEQEFVRNKIQLIVQRLIKLLNEPAAPIA